MIGSILSKLFCGLLPFGFQWSEVSIWVILIAGGGGVLAPRSCRGLLLGAGLRLASEESVEVLLPRHLVVELQTKVRKISQSHTRGLLINCEIFENLRLKLYLVVAGQRGGVRLHDTDVPGHRHALE